MEKEENHEHHEHHKHHEHKTPEIFSIKKSNMWKYSTALAVLLLIISIFTGGFGINKGGVDGAVSAEEASQKAISFINANMLQPGTSATFKSVSKSGGVYSVDITIGGQDFTSYVSQDGKLLFAQGVDMTQEIAAPAASPTAQPAPQDTPKSDKPEVELFVMSHCPYGTQAEKGIIPAVKALGNDVDFNVRFVYYAMHAEKEVTEQTRQYCIQKEQNDKFLDYLGCFLKEGESGPCLTQAEIDSDMMDSCVEEADKEFEITTNLEDKSQWLNGNFPKFNIDAELNSEYGIGGSPTLVINGKQVQSGRDSASYLATICGAFNDMPKACNTEFSSSQPSPGFGFGESDTEIASTCG